MKRRKVLSRMFALGTAAGLGGCLAHSPDGGTATTRAATDGGVTTEPTNSGSGDADETTTCDSMHGSELEVTEVGKPDERVIRFSNLSDAERAVVSRALDDGVLRTCGVPDALRSFAHRVAKRTGDDDFAAYLGRDATYYRLSLRIQDQVFAD